MWLEKFWYESSDTEMHEVGLQGLESREGVDFLAKQKNMLDELSGEVATLDFLNNKEFNYVWLNWDIDQDLLRGEFDPKVGEYEFIA